MLQRYSEPRGAIGLSICVALFTCVKFAIAQPVEPKLEPRLIPSHLVRFELVLGRIQLSPEYFRIGTAYDRTILTGERERVRSISVSVMRGKPTLKFQDRGGDEAWNVTFKSDHLVDILFSVGVGAESKTLTYHQPSDGPITAKIGYGDGRTAEQVQALSLWHIAFENADFFEAHLQPMLMRIDPSWEVASVTTATRDLLNKPLHRSEAAAIRVLVDKLDAAISSERCAANVELEGLGLAAEMPLRECLGTELSHQQRVVIEKMLAAMQPVGNDTPMRLAVWMSPATGSHK